MESRMMFHVFLHSCAAFKCILYKSLFNFSFFLYRNLISSFSQIVCLFFCVTFVAGDVYVIFMLAYFGITFLIRHC